MSVTFRCPGCQQQYKVFESMAGMTTPCKKCGLAMVIPAPASAPAPQPSPLNLTDLLEDAAVASGEQPSAPANFTLPPLAPAARRMPRSQVHIEWRRLLGRVLLSPLGIAFVTALVGLVVYLVLPASPAARDWAMLCALIGLGMAAVGYIWLLCVFFPRASQNEVFVLIVLPICSVVFNIVANLNLAAIVGALGPNLTLTIIYVYGLGNLLIVLYGFVWIGMNFRWAARSACVWWLGIIMLVGASLGVRSLEPFRRDRVAAATAPPAENVPQIWADAPREAPPLAPQPVPRPVELPPPAAPPVNGFDVHPVPGPAQPGVAPNPASKRARGNPARRPEMPVPPVGFDFGPMAQNRFKSGARPGAPGFAPGAPFGAPTARPGGLTAPSVRSGRATKVLGGSGGMPFEAARAGSNVLGFEFRMGSWAGQPALAQFQPVYDRRARGPQQVVAKDG